MFIKSRRDLRLASGLVLFTYVTLHLAAHAFGLVSINVAESALRATVLFWHSGIGTMLLYSAAAIHIGLALVAVYDRRTLRMPPVQALRIVLGLTMPLVLIGHFVGTRYAFERFGLAADYHRVVGNLWATGGQGRQLALLAPGWLHGCLGLNFAFGSRRTWQQLRFVLFGAALLLPVLAGLGFLMMGRELAEPPAAVDASRVSATATSIEGTALVDMREGVLAAYLGLIGLMVAARVVRSFDERRRGSSIRISYPERSVSVPRGWSVLEASRAFGVAHQSTCGGRARCTTCRVRVTEGQAHCPAPAIDERRALDRMAANADVRLACQLRPTGDISLRPLVAVEKEWWRAGPPARTTTEREVAVLFLEVHFGATGAAGGAKTTLAHDILYALEHFHAVATAAIESAGGVQCRHSGDSWMALFGLDADGVRRSLRQALVAAQQIEARFAVLTGRLARELSLDADFSVVVHVGPVVAGMIGEGETRRLSAVGDAIRAAERLHASARRQGARFAISNAAADAAGIADPTFIWRTAGDGAPPMWTGSSARVLVAASRDLG